MTSKQTITFLPPPDVGLHQWVCGRAFYLRGIGATKTSAFKALRSVCDNYPVRRPVPDREIEAALDAAYKADPSVPRAEAGPVVFDPVAGWPKQITLPKVNQSEKRINHLLGLPVPRSPETSPKVTLRDFFQAGDLICVGKSAAKFEVANPWSSAFNPSGWQFVVPNPLRKRVGQTSGGYSSNHCRDAVGDRRYIIFESDNGRPKPEQMHILRAFAIETESHLTAVIDSGGKSLHGWFLVETIAPDVLFDWFKLAISVGADPRLLLPEQFVRAPGGVRDDGKPQTILYANL